MSEATFQACVTPTPPGVTEVTLASELPPATCISVSKLTGIPYALRNTAITPSPAHQLDERRQEHAPEEGAAAAEDRAALLRLVPPLDDVRPVPAHEQHDQEGAAAEDDDRGGGVLVHPAERDVERAADAEEEVEVGEGAGER